MSRIPEVPDLVGKKSSDIFQARAQQSSGRYYGTNHVGTASLIVFDTVPGLDWRVAVSVPQKEIDGLLQNSIIALALIGLSLGGIGAALAYAMQRRLARSVASVGALAATFRDDVPAIAETSPVREIAEVSKALLIASRELRENEARFRGVFDSSVMGFSIFDANNGATLAINDRFLAMTGHSRADFDEGRWDWRTFTPPEFQALDEEAIRQARAQGWWSSYEKEYIRTDGTRFPVRISSGPLNGSAGRVVVAIEDITEEARAREAVARSEAVARAQAEELASIYHAAPVGLCVLDRELRFVRINARLAEINGIPAADHVGRFGPRGRPGSQRPGLRGHAARARRRGDQGPGDVGHHSRAARRFCAPGARTGCPCGTLRETSSGSRPRRRKSPRPRRPRLRSTSPSSASATWPTILLP